MGDILIHKGINVTNALLLKTLALRKERTDELVVREVLFVYENFKVSNYVYGGEIRPEVFKPHFYIGNCLGPESNPPISIVNSYLDLIRKNEVRNKINLHLKRRTNMLFQCNKSDCNFIGFDEDFQVGWHEIYGDPLKKCSECNGHKFVELKTSHL